MLIHNVMLSSVHFEPDTSSVNVLLTLTYNFFIKKSRLIINNSVNVIGKNSFFFLIYIM